MVSNKICFYGKIWPLNIPVTPSLPGHCNLLSNKNVQHGTWGLTCQGIVIKTELNLKLATQLIRPSPTSGEYFLGLASGTKMYVMYINPITLRTAKTQLIFGCSHSNSVNG